MRKKVIRENISSNTKIKSTGMQFYCILGNKEFIFLFKRGISLFASFNVFLNSNVVPRRLGD